MNQDQLRLTDLGPIDGLHMRLEQAMEGWTMVLYHRHVGGQHGDCEREEYAELSLAEAMDVLMATLTTIGHASLSA